MAPAAMSLATASSPLARVVRLLNAAFPLLDASHPAYQYISEALDTAGHLDEYMEQCSTGIIVPSSHAVPEAEVQKVMGELFEATETHDWGTLYKEGKTEWALSSDMCSGPYEASYLQHVALDTGARNVLEIGLFTGTATLALGLLPKVERIVALDIEAYLEAFDRPYWKRAGVSDKITTMIAPAIGSLQKLKDQNHPQFDLVFIDADKPSYLAYVNTILKLDLLSPNGVILADNTLYKGYPYADGEVHSPTAKIRSNNRSSSEAVQGIRDFNDGVRAHPDLHAVMLPIRDGITVIRRRI